MEKNISLKVFYQQTIRRFAVSKDVNWSELENSIRTLFSLPSTFPFALTYKDEDNDIITLRSDLELQDILSQPRHASTLKFVLVPYDTQIESNEGNAHEEEEEEGISYYTRSSETEIPPRPYSVSSPNCEVEELIFPESKSDEKGKQKAENTDSSYHSKSSPYDEQEDDEDEERSTTPPSIDLAAQFQKLIDQFRPLIEQQPHLLKQADEIMDQILKNAPVNIEFCIQWFKDQVKEVQQKLSAANTKFMEEDGKNIVEGIQRIVQNSQVIAHNARRFIPVERVRRRRSMAEEEKDEKLRLLRSMGFWNDQRNEELLKKHCGKVEKVVEILIAEKNDAADDYTIVDNEVQMEEL